jgi:3',5'-cyclic AMP phosphodiesterase CpdA
VNEPPPERAWHVAQISDLHIVEEGERCVGEIDTAAFLRRAVAALGRLDPPPEVVLITGDLVNDGRPAQYAHLRQLLEPLEVELLVLPGNHDARAPLRQALGLAGGQPVGGEPPEDAPCDFAVRIGPLHLVGLDSLVPGRPGGALVQAQLDRLDETLASMPEAPTIVALHHPPFVTGIGHMDAMRLAPRSADAVAAVIARHPQVERVVCGHVHRSILRRWAGTLAMVVPGAAHAVIGDLRPGARPGWNFEPPAITLHRWHPDDGLVSHLLPIGPHADHWY